MAINHLHGLGTSPSDLKPADLAVIVTSASPIDCIVGLLQLATEVFQALTVRKRCVVLSKAAIIGNYRKEPVS